MYARYPLRSDSGQAIPLEVAGIVYSCAVNRQAATGLFIPVNSIWSLSATTADMRVLVTVSSARPVVFDFVAGLSNTIYVPKGTTCISTFSTIEDLYLHVTDNVGSASTALLLCSQLAVWRSLSEPQETLGGE